MTDDPPRLKDSGGPGDALLRRAGRVPPMAHDDRAAILGALGAGAAGGAGGAGAAPSSTGGAGSAGAATSGAGSAGGGVGSAGGALATLKTPLALALAGALLGGIAVVAVRAWSATPAPETPTPATAEVAAAPASAIVPPPPLPAPAETPPEPVAAPSATPAVKHARGAPSASQPAEDTLAAESALVGRARATLEATPAAALALLEDHARRFPRGELAAERDFLRLKALRRVGRTDEARERARTYATRYPSSPYAPAVRTILAELGER